MTHAPRPVRARFRAPLLQTLQTLWLLAPLLAAADTPPLPVKAEVQALLIRLENSRCRFYRNGDWHSASEARLHLQHKLDYLQDRLTLGSAEQFIELAASKSSWSGTPYQFQCGTAEALNSETWMRQQLQSIRSGADTSASPQPGAAGR